MNIAVILIPLLLITLSLSACATGGRNAPAAPIVQADPPAAEPSPAPNDQAPPAAPAPPSVDLHPGIPMPARRVFAAAWPGPSIGLTGFIDRYTPPTFAGGDPNAKWFTNHAEGIGGMDCIDPAPNNGYHCEDGCLVLTPGQQPPDTGFPIISAQTFSKDFHLAVDSEVWFDDVGQYGSYAGPVLDNGEPNYVAFYGQNGGDGEVSVIVDQYVTGSPRMDTLALKTWHSFRIHYYPDGTMRFELNGAEIFPTGLDTPMKFKNDPHLSVFAGGFKAVKVRKLEVWSADPAAVEV